MGNYAFFDIGSNSVICLAVSVEGGKSTLLYDNAIVTGLGRGLSAEGLHADSKHRTFEALKKHVNHLDTLGENFQKNATATSAMRDAKDGQLFAAAIHAELGIDVDIISGETEAELTWMAIQKSFPSSQKRIVIDIGGGSTEFMLGDESGLQFRTSLDIGAVRLTGRHIEGDPPSGKAIEALQGDARSHTQTLPTSLKDVPCVGTAGTITTLLAMRDGVEPYDPTRIHGQNLSLKDVNGIVAKLSSLSIAKRSEIPGLSPKRAEVILAGAIILAESMKGLGLNQLKVSDRGLRFGTLAKFLPDVDFPRV